RMLHHPNLRRPSRGRLGYMQVLRGDWASLGLNVTLPNRALTVFHGPAIPPQRILLVDGREIRV
ncbi:MAG TPA: hypothetical protein VF306_22670, partial [Pirellulales bacterium]